MNQEHQKIFSEARFRLLTGLQEWFPLLAETLGSVAQAPQFDHYLASYRGLAGDHVPDGTLQQELGERVVQFFLDLVSRTGFAFAAASADPVQVASTLRELEESTNLALYYWMGQGKRDFQFRTVVHFAGLEGLGAVLFSAGGSETFVSLSEHGIRFGPADDAHIPRVAPMVHALGLDAFSTLSPLPDVRKRLFARLRTVQREICLLEEEWEHRNALLAVSHSRLRDDFRRQQTAAAEEALRENTLELGEHRNFLATWCLESFAALQEWLVELTPLVQTDADLRSEWEATHTLILSGLQKLYLPASVSRHQYDDRVARLLLRWSEARLRHIPEDLSTEILRHVFKRHLGMASEPPLHILKKKPFEWALSCDPTSGLKTFCWRLRRSEHLECAGLTLVALAKKLSPDPLNEFWIANIASLVEMPHSFPNPAIPPEPGDVRVSAVLASACGEALARVRVGDDFAEDLRLLSQNLTIGTGISP